MLVVWIWLDMIVRIIYVQGGVNPLGLWDQTTLAWGTGSYLKGEVFIPPPYSPSPIHSLWKSLVSQARIFKVRGRALGGNRRETFPWPWLQTKEGWNKRTHSLLKGGKGARNPLAQASCTSHRVWEINRVKVRHPYFLSLHCCQHLLYFWQYLFHLKSSLFENHLRWAKTSEREGLAII